MELILSGGKTCTVPDELFERLSKFRWHLDGDGYAKWNTEENGKKIETHLSREILSAKLKRRLIRGEEADHRNGNILDNSFENLRPCSHLQNLQNQRKKMRGGRASSQYKGVHLHKKSGRWVSKIRVNGESIALGMYNDEYAAGMAYDHAAIKYFGEFARLNFPPVAPAPSVGPAGREGT